MRIHATWLPNCQWHSTDGPCWVTVCVYALIRHRWRLMVITRPSPNPFCSGTMTCYHNMAGRSIRPRRGEGRKMNDLSSCYALRPVYLAILSFYSRRWTHHQKFRILISPLAGSQKPTISALLLPLQS